MKFEKFEINAFASFYFSYPINISEVRMWRNYTPKTTITVGERKPWKKKCRKNCFSKNKSLVQHFIVIRFIQRVLLQLFPLIFSSTIHTFHILDNSRFAWNIYEKYTGAVRSNKKKRKKKKKRRLSEMCLILKITFL